MLDTHFIDSKMQMQTFGRQLAKQLKTPQVLVLSGPLGVGKTEFVKGFVKSLGYQGNISSPTFSLVNHYDIPQQAIFHFDFYRLNQIHEIWELGWEDYLDSDGWLLIEWGEKFPKVLPKNTTYLQFSYADNPEHRLVQL